MISRQRSFSVSIVLLGAAAWLSVLLQPIADQAIGESSLDLLSGFDRERVESAYPVANENAAAEMAKLLYRLRRADAAVVSSRAEPLSSDHQVGDVVKVTGVITAIRQYKVPESLVEVLDLKVFQEVELFHSESGETLQIFAPPFKGTPAKGDMIGADGIVVQWSLSMPIFAAGQLAWTPGESDRVGWQMLAEEGIDLSRIAELSSRNRRTLESADSDAFYSLLAAAKRIDKQAEQEAQGLPQPTAADPVRLLGNPKNYHGQWIRLRVSTVRITRISVTDPQRQQQLGQDFYFQVDCSGDLGKTVVKLKRSEGEAGEPILMSGSYPVSLVSCTLPDFLLPDESVDDSIVFMTSLPVSVDGFFFRLWSYQNEFMDREGGGKQVGPLVVVSRWRSRLPAEKAADGTEYFGYALAVLILSAIVGTFWWSRRNARDDARRAGVSQPAKIDL